MTTDEFNREPPGTGSGPNAGDQAAVVLQIVEALRGLRFGQVTITVHDGTVVQIERIERTRFQPRDK